MPPGSSTLPEVVSPPIQEVDKIDSRGEEALELFLHPVPVTASTMLSPAPSDGQCTHTDVSSFFTFCSHRSWRHSRWPSVSQGGTSSTFLRFFFFFRFTAWRVCYLLWASFLDGLSGTATMALTCFLSLILHDSNHLSFSLSVFFSSFFFSFILLHLHTDAAFLGSGMMISHWHSGGSSHAF